MKVRNKSKEVIIFTEAQKKEWGITRELTAAEAAEWTAIEEEEIDRWVADYKGDFETRVFGTADNPRSPFSRD